MDFTAWQRRAIGVPFVSGGRDYNGWDCWGLVVCAWRDVRGVDVPDYAYPSVNDYRRLARLFTDRGASHWRSLVLPEPMSVACIYRRGRVIHAGLYAGNGRIIHVEEGVETCLEKVTNVRVEGWYAPHSRAAPVPNGDH